MGDGITTTDFHLIHDIGNDENERESPSTGGIRGKLDINPKRNIGNSVYPVIKVANAPGGGSIAYLDSNVVKTLPNDLKNKLTRNLGFTFDKKTGSMYKITEPTWIEQNKNLIGNLGLGLNVLSSGTNIFKDIKEINALDKYIDVLKEQLNESKSEYKHIQEGREHLKQVFS